MATKTLKPGEYAIGGLIKITTTASQIKISFLDYMTKKPIGIDQTFPVENSKLDVFMFVAEHATAYWADMVTDWIETKIDRNKFTKSRW